MRNLVGLQFTYQKKGNSSSHTILIGKEEGKPFKFSIDGPGGEYITEVRVAEPRAVVAPVMTVRCERPWTNGISILNLTATH